MVRDERAEGDGARLREKFACHGADFFAEFGGAAGGVAVPEGHFAGFAGSRRDENAIVRDFVDAPGGGAEDDRVAGARFEHHFFVEFADASAFRGAGKKNAVEAAIGNGAAVDDGDAARALAGVRRFETRSQVMRGRSSANSSLGIAAGEHVEDGFEHGAREIGVGRGGTDELEKVVDVPLVDLTQPGHNVHGETAHGDDHARNDDHSSHVLDGRQSPRRGGIERHDRHGSPFEGKGSFE